MKEYRVFSLYSADKLIEYNAFRNIVELFIEKYQLPKPESQMYIFKVLYESGNYWKLKKLDGEANEYNIKIQEHTYKMEYDVDDLKKAMFFEMKLGIYGREDHTENYQTDLIDFYCESCNTHQYVPKAEVYINKSEFRGKDIAASMSYNNEIIVSDKMKKMIEESKLTGIVFYPAYHYNNRLKNEYFAWRMNVTSIMPPIDKSMPVYIIDGYCKECQKHHILPLSFVRYKRDELKRSCDFNLSCETFGAGWYGSPKLIVSKKVYDLIITNKIKGCNFEIVGEVCI